MATTFYDLHNQLRAEIGDYFSVPQAKLYIQRAMHEVSKRTQWSWLMAYGQLVAPVAIDGQATVVENALTLTVDATTATAINALTTIPIARRQIRIGSGGNIYEIRVWDGVNTLTVNYPIAKATGTHACTIYKCYYLPPSIEQAAGVAPLEDANFKTYHVIKDKSNNFPLILNQSTEWLDKRDPRRDSMGTPTHMLQMPPTTIRFTGSGNDPNQIPPGTPRCELWPGPTGSYVYEALYEKLYWDLPDNPTSTLPETLNPALVLNTAVFNAYKWVMAQRNTSASQRVAMRDLLAITAQERDRLYLEDYREDKLQYAARVKDLTGGKFPWVMGAAYAQTHDIYSMTGFYPS